MKALAILLYCMTFLTACMEQAFVVESEAMIPTINPGDKVRVEKRVSAGSLEMGDIIAFWNDSDRPTLLLLRVIANAGDKVRFQEDGLYLNNKNIVLNNYKYTVSPLYSYGYDQTYIVPERGVFVIGDNFEGAYDSRSFGPVYAEQIVGRVTSIEKKK